jgi:transposase
VELDQEAVIRVKFEALAPVLNEAASRVWAALEARALGHGGIACVARATGLARGTIVAGLRDLDDPEQLARLAAGQVRRPGGGRKPVTVNQPELVAALERLVSPATRGDPMSPLRWTSKSTEKLAAALHAAGFRVSADTVGTLLKAQGYSLQAPRKTLEGGDHPDRDAQFQHIAAQVTRMQAADQPVISVDCKKKELVGEFKNGGREWQPAGHPEAVNVYDFVDDALFKVEPLRGVRRDAQRGLGERGDRPRHGGVRRGDDPAVVAADGQGALPAGDGAVRDGRRRRAATGRATGCGSVNFNVWPTTRG